MPSSAKRAVAVLLPVVKAVDRKLLSGIIAYASQRQTWTLYTEDPDTGDEPIRRGPRSFAKRWDGAIVSFDDPRRAQAMRKRIPLVGVGGGYGWYNRSKKIPYVATDNVAVAHLAAEHLMERGFTHFAFCGFTPTRTNGWSRERQEAFAEVLAKAGRGCAIRNTPPPSLANWSNIQHDLASWLSELPRPLGLMACNDARARHVLQACSLIGLRTPEEVAVIGVDDDTAICDATHPRLSSIDQGRKQTGYQAAALLDLLMDGKKIRSPIYTVPPAGIVVRQSTDVLAVQDPEVAAAVRFIREHAFERIGLSDVLNATQSSYSTLRRRFKAALGRTIHDEILRVRVKRAKELLVATDWSLKHIAKACGLTSARYMAAVLRRQDRLSPSEYRHRHRRWLTSEDTARPIDN